MVSQPYFQMSLRELTRLTKCSFQTVSLNTSASRTIVIHHWICGCRWNRWAIPIVNRNSSFHHSRMSTWFMPPWSLGL
eukprot:3777575-Ditylum_brightwellii.AAC.1